MTEKGNNQANIVLELAAVGKALSLPGNRVLVATHARADGDALGSQAAMCRMLRAAGTAALAATEPTGGAASFVLEGVPCLTPEKAAAERWNTLLALDCADADRLPEALSHSLRTTATIINIDHHAGNSRFGTLNWIDPGAAATGEMALRLAQAQGWPIDRDTAEALWVAIVTDTGRFGHANTSASTLRAAADLLEAAPVRTDIIQDRLYGRLPLRVLRLRARALSSLEVWHDGRVSAVRLGPEDFAASGCTGADIEDTIELPRSLENAVAAVLCYETDPVAATRVSVRTQPPLDAAAFCRRFGGGGHARAAGCTIPLPLDQTWEVVRLALGVEV